MLVERARPYSSSSTFYDLLPRHRRRRGAQLRQLLLVDLAVLRRQELGVDERGELADLHRRALHLAERPRHLQRRLEVARLELLLGALLRAGDAGRLGARVAGRLAAQRRAQLRRAADACPFGILCSSRTRAQGSPPRPGVMGLLYPQPPMASDRATLEGRSRATDFGSRASRRLRREGFVPGVVYGGGEEARAFQVAERARSATCCPTAAP